MNRIEWKRAYGAARRASKGKDCILAIGLDYWTMLQDQRGRSLYPSIIRDRSLSSRLAEELRWAAEYRRAAVKTRGWREMSNVQRFGAMACIEACRKIRERASRFQVMA